MLPFHWQRRLLQATGTALIVSSVGIGLAALFLPLARNGPREKSAPIELTSTEDSTASDQRLSADDFQYVWGKKFRRPLVDPEVEPTEPEQEPDPTPPPVRFDGQLIATLVANESIDSRGWLKFERQAVQMVRPGEVLEDIPGSPEVISIGNRTMKVNLQGRELSIDAESNESVFQVVKPAEASP
jgi:hypothetical protein